MSQWNASCSKDWLNSQAAVWYEEGISKLVLRYGKCLNVQGEKVALCLKGTCFKSRTGYRLLENDRFPSLSCTYDP